MFPQGGQLCKHEQGYKASLKRLNNNLTNYGEIDQIMESLKNDRLYFTKYTNSFASVKSGNTVREAYLQLEPNGNVFNIYIKKFKYVAAYKYNMDDESRANQEFDDNILLAK